MAENFSILLKDINPQSEIWKSSRTDVKKKTLMNIIVKLKKKAKGNLKKKSSKTKKILHTVNKDMHDC